MSQFINADVSGGNVLSLYTRSGHLFPTWNDVDPNRWLKKGIWAYFLLLVFEGALRKWVLPGLATPLLIIRDPVAFWLLVMAWKRGLLPNDLTLAGMMLIGLLTTFTGFYLGHGNLFVVLYGARIFLLHFPLIFVIGNIFTASDAVKVGKVVLWLCIPMTSIILLQFYSPQSAWINRGIGGDMNGSGFSGAMGYFRPSGTFSFTSGVSSFFAFAAAYIFYFWFQTRSMNRLVLVVATFCLLVAIPISISRTLFFSVIVSLCFACGIMLKKPKYLGRVLFAGLVLVMLSFLLSKNSEFQHAIQVFGARFESANNQEGGLEGVLLDRYLGGMIDALRTSSAHYYFGFGSGMGTNVGAMLLSGKQTFLISEGEWGRLIGELGPLMGMLVIFLRIRLSAKMAIGAYSKLQKGMLLPWMLLSFVLLQLPQGGWAQPTSLGFCVFISGLLLATLRKQETGPSV
ncbi:hypothetical protein V9K67_05755 [Paraflavisolibacter sp. H34]|uniref:hypothetical protein n=1 Tax=Huijunlia imazamoxiresistens TaxID=3127457 RepID=UPI003017C4E9